MRNIKSDLSGAYLNATLPAYRTPYPVTCFNFTPQTGADSDAYVNWRIVDAHKEIEKTGKSPYLAWAEVLGFKSDDLPGLLALDHVQCDRLLAHPDRSPPPEKIHFFCRKIGVHPAYLLPTLRNDRHACHYPILRAVAQIYKDTKMPEREREISRLCLEIERGRLQRLRSENGVAFSYLKQAESFIQNLQGAMESSTGILHTFEHKSKNPASDIDLGLDLFGQDLCNDIQKLANDQARLSKADSCIYEVLTCCAQTLYGEEYAEDSVDELVRNIRNAEERLVESHYWGFSKEGMISGHASHGYNEIVFESPVLHHDFEVRAREDGMHPEDVKEMFADHLAAYISMSEQRDRQLATLDGYRNGYARFTAWRDSAEAQSRHIPTLANYILANRALGRQLLLPAPANHQDAARPLPPSYVHT